MIILDVLEMDSREKELTKMISRILVGRAGWTVVLFTELGLMGRG